MPFYLIPKTADTPECLRVLSVNHTEYPVGDTPGTGSIILPDTTEPVTVPSFSHPAKAHAANPDPKQFVVRYVTCYAEADEWRARERYRFREGDYAHIPWKPFVPDDLVDHFAHLSLKFPGKVAFTASHEHGVLDRQTVMTPGRYLERYYADTFTREERENYIAQCGADALALKFAITADEIEAVYCTEHAPTSCMDGAHKADGDIESDIHPVRVYGDSDLQLAYVGEPHVRIRARCIVWPEAKIYSRAYGAVALIHTLLERAGFSHGDVDGAHVRLIREGGNIVMPYVDGISHARESLTRRGFVQLGRGPISTDSANGYGYQEDDEDTSRCCDRCGDEYDPSDEGNDEYCSHCLESRVTCDHCNHHMWEDDANTIDDPNGTTYTLCDRCNRTWTDSCAVCGETFYTDQFSSEEDARRAERGVTDHCATCAAAIRYCRSCESENDQHDMTCTACGEPLRVRCAHTGDLLANVGALPDVATFTSLLVWNPGDVVSTGYAYVLFRIYRPDDPLLSVSRPAGHLHVCHMTRVSRLPNTPSTEQARINCYTSADSTRLSRIAAQRDYLRSMYPDYRYQILEISPGFSPFDDCLAVDVDLARSLGGA